MSEPQREIKITVDNEQTKLLAKELAKAELEKEQLKQQLAQIAFREIERKLDANSIMDEEKRKFYHDNINQFSLDYPSRAGIAPLNSRQYGSNDSLYNRKFGSQKEMVDEITRVMHEGKTQQERAEARSYYDKLMEIENLPLLTKTPEGFVTPQDKNEGDIGKILKKWKLEREQKMKEGAPNQ
ncbi:MAG: hypothetical protein ABSF65_01990 [Candidatus Bathyarchaeia archaeon]